MGRYGERERKRIARKEGPREDGEPRSLVFLCVQRSLGPSNLWMVSFWTLVQAPPVATLSPPLPPVKENALAQLPSLVWITGTKEKQCQATSP